MGENMPEFQDKLPQDAVKVAIRIIEQQGATPVSPGEWRDGKIALCAGAALAAAGLTCTGQHERRSQFELQLLNSSKSTEPIRQTFRELGWSLDLCSLSIIANDSFVDSARRDGVLHFLHALAH